MDEAISSLLFPKDVIPIRVPDVMQDGRESDGRHSADRDTNLTNVRDHLYRGI
jgi:hypothetical protein